MTIIVYDQQCISFVWPIRLWAGCRKSASWAVVFGCRPEQVYLSDHLLQTPAACQRGTRLRRSCIHGKVSLQIDDESIASTLPKSSQAEITKTNSIELAIESYGQRLSFVLPPTHSSLSPLRRHLLSLRDTTLYPNTICPSTGMVLFHASPRRSHPTTPVITSYLHAATKWMGIQHRRTPQTVDETPRSSSQCLFRPNKHNNRHNLRSKPTQPIP